MSLFVDASAIVAVLAREPEAGTFEHIVASDSALLTSAIAIWEATRGLAGAQGITFEEARHIVSDYVSEFEIGIVGIGAEEATLALDAHQRYGKGRHRAKLKMGVCFAYACAKRHADIILFKGDDFIHTDLKDATLA